MVFFVGSFRRERGHCYIGVQLAARERRRAISTFIERFMRVYQHCSALPNRHLQYKAIINKRRQYSKALILVDEVEVCAVQNTNQETLLLMNVRSMGLAAL